jgi:N-dimethylarginine dimethylaminohydrolase
MTVLALPSDVPVPRTARPRHYLMCRPEHFTVSYSINPWMDPDVPVSADLAVAQWERLRRTYLDLGHAVDVIAPVPGLPDMVYAANGGTTARGRALGAKFRFPERADEGPAYLAWLREAGLSRVKEPRATNEGEGDFLVVGDRILAGTGFRTSRAAHAEAQEFFGLPVTSLTLVDPRFYHLDTALAVLDDQTVAYYPAAFSPGSQEVLRTLFPDAIIASEADAAVLGLNVVSDGRNVVVAAAAEGLIAQLAAHGFTPIPVDLSELLKGGGGPKCCTLEIRA